jgi:hypothetical protein
MVAVLPKEDIPKDNSTFWMTFIDPLHKTRTSLPVTKGPSHETEGGFPVWHIDLVDEHTVITFPSIHVPDEYHSPVNVTWRLVANEDLEKEAGL